MGKIGSNTDLWAVVIGDGGERFARFAMKLLSDYDVEFGLCEDVYVSTARLARTIRQNILVIGSLSGLIAENGRFLEIAREKSMTVCCLVDVNSPEKLSIAGRNKTLLIERFDELEAIVGTLAEKFTENASTDYLPGRGDRQIILSPNENSKILLVGDLSDIFTDSVEPGSLNCIINSNILDAIDTAAKGIYSTIAVSVQSANSATISALKVLRDISPSSKIVLMAKMHNEPQAMKLVNNTYDGRTLADDYLVCPVRSEKFLRPHGKSDIDAHPESAADDKSLSTKISRLTELATTDELTGLKNRRYIWEFARQIIDRARARNAQVTLLVFDIDNFKHYNDVYSHLAGDEILRQASLLIKRSCRGHDVVGRIGGDEFAVVFWDEHESTPADKQSERRSHAADHPSEPIFIANRFRRELQTAELHMLGPEGKGVLTISGGLATFPRDGSTILELFEQADAALLQAKRSGKNRIYLVGGPDSDIKNIK